MLAYTRTRLNPERLASGMTKTKAILHQSERTGPDSIIRHIADMNHPWTHIPEKMHPVTGLRSPQPDQYPACKAHDLSRTTSVLGSFTLATSDRGPGRRGQAEQMTGEQVTNKEIAHILREVADILTLKGVAFRPQAYYRAAQTIEALDEDITDIHDRGELETIPGVGTAIAEKIRTVIEEGTLPYLDTLRGELPGGLFELLEIEGIGPKKALILHKELGITGITDLEVAVKAKQVQRLDGFGEQSEKNILENIRVMKERDTRFLLGTILDTAEALEERLRNHPAVQQACLAGSVRRRKETIGDLDILVATDDPDTVSEFFCTHPDVQRVVMQGPKRSTVVVDGNLHVDLRVVEQKQFGAALQYFTGSKAHNIHLRQRAIKEGRKLSEYGLFARDGGEVIARRAEREIYEALGLAYIPPELREDTGEIEAAEKGELPRLIRYGEVRGDLHVHTRWSDGANTISEMAEAARTMGREYIAICDHSAGLAIAHGMTDERIHNQGTEIAKLNRTLDGITVLHGIETNILRDGTPDVKKGILRDLDFTIASIHSGFRQPKKEMTERMLTAIHHDHIDMIGHPTGRLILKRKPYELDADTVFEAAAAAHVMMEINAFPTRLDLTDVHCRRARTWGVSMGIGTDAHHVDHLGYLDFGVAVARRGWLEMDDVVNTRTLAGLQKWLEI